MNRYDTLVVRLVALDGDGLLSSLETTVRCEHASHGLTSPEKIGFKLASKIKKPKSFHELTK